MLRPLRVPAFMEFEIGGDIRLEVVEIDHRREIA